jgi:ParB family chromosome partitioning protein
MVEDAVRVEIGGPEPAAPADSPTPSTGAIDGAGLTPATKLRPPGLLELERLLAEQLETRVSVQMSAKKGRVSIEFADLEDLERIYRVIAG